MNPRVARVRTMPNYLLVIEFDNGEIKKFDVKPYLDIGVFRQLREEAYFSRASSSLGTVVWPDGQDFCPDTLYGNSHSKLQGSKSYNRRGSPVRGRPLNWIAPLQ